MCPYRPVLALLSCGREMEKMTKLAYSHGNVAKGKLFKTKDLMARLERLELPTRCLEGSCS